MAQRYHDCRRYVFRQSVCVFMASWWKELNCMMTIENLLLISLVVLPHILQEHLPEVYGQCGWVVGSLTILMAMLGQCRINGREVLRIFSAIPMTCQAEVVKLPCQSEWLLVRKRGGRFILHICHRKLCHCYVLMTRKWSP